MPTTLWPALYGMEAAETNDELIAAALEVDTAPTVAEVNTFIGRLDVSAWTVRKRLALTDIQAFLNRGGNLAFRNMSRTLVALQLIPRVFNYGYINQESRNICGPAVLVHAVARENPRDYARFVIAMAEHGRANLKRMDINPGRNILVEAPAHDNIPHADYIALASLRSSTAYLGYDKTLNIEMLQGATIGSTIAAWMREAGFSRVATETSSGWSRFNRNVTQAGRTTQGRNSALNGSLRDAIARAKAGDAVMMCISPNLASVIVRANVQLNRDWDLSTKKGWGNFGKAAFTSHWVLLEDAEVHDAGATAFANGHLIGGPGVRFKITTWGQQSPDLAAAVTVPYSKIASWYWGYVAGDPRGRP